MLPNPFSSNVLLPNPSLVPAIAIPGSLNPGPGLPQAQVTVYKTPVFQPPQPQNGYNQRPNYGRGSFSNSQHLSFSCDLCDRGFKSKELLDYHISEHVPCGINGCKFVAHPKIVEKHIQMQHDTGLAEKIMRLTTPEEIEKWKEERKRNFPSAQNVARRQAEQKEKLERGEVLYEPKTRFGRGGNQRGSGRGRGRGQERGRGRGRGRGGYGDGDRSNQPPTHHATKQVEKASPTSIPLPKSVSENATDIKPSPGKCEAKRKVDLSDGEIESDDESQEVAVPVKPNALSGLMACYASSEEEVKPQVEKMEVPVPNPDIVKQDVMCAKEESKVPEQQRKEQKNTRKRPTKRQKKKGPATSNQVIPAKRLTLLQKLLQGEILHERNVILQCVHYIVQQNFFGVGEIQVPQASELNHSDISPSILDQSAIDSEKSAASS